jgi:ribosome-associated protein
MTKAITPKTRKKKTNPQEELVKTIVEAMQDKKAKVPVVMDFSPIPGAAFDRFVICHGMSRTQVEAIADNVDRQVRKDLGLHPWHKEGFENAEWILIDYGDVVVHVFQESRRSFYNLEQLWADAEITRIEQQS